MGGEKYLSCHKNQLAERKIMLKNFTFLLLLLAIGTLLSGCCTSLILDHCGRVSLQIKETRVEQSETAITVSHSGNIRTEYFLGFASTDDETTTLTHTFTIDPVPENVIFFTETFRIETFADVPRFRQSPYPLYSTEIGQWQIHPDDIPLTGQPYISCNHLGIRRLAIPTEVTENDGIITVKGFYVIDANGNSDIFPENNDLYLPEHSDRYRWLQLCVSPIPVAMDIALLPLQILAISLLGM